MTTTTENAQAIRHAAAVERAWHNHGRQVAAEVLCQYDGAFLADARSAAAVLRETTVKSLYEPVIETANWLRCCDGVCPEGTL